MGVFSQDYKNGSFKPNFEVNGETGKLRAVDAEIEGNITARSIITDPNSAGRTTLNENSDKQLKFRYPNGSIAARFGLVSEKVQNLYLL